jgi:hypothetical protein
MFKRHDNNNIEEKIQSFSLVILQRVFYVILINISIVYCAIAARSSFYLVKKANFILNIFFSIYLIISLIFHIIGKY